MLSANILQNIIKSDRRHWNNLAVTDTLAQAPINIWFDENKQVQML